MAASPSHACSAFAIPSLPLMPPSPQLSDLPLSLADVLMMLSFKSVFKVTSIAPSFTLQPLPPGALSPSVTTHFLFFLNTPSLLMGHKTRVFIMFTVYCLTLFTEMGTEGRGPLSFLMELKGLEQRERSLLSINIWRMGDTLSPSSQ